MWAKSVIRMSSNDLKLIGKVVLVTGASQGLGFEIAKRFVAEGASVVICARSSTDIQSAKTELLTNLHKDQQILALTCDVSAPAEVDTVFQRLNDQLGVLHAVVSNAGVYGPLGPIDEINWDEWLQAIAINLSGAAYVLRKSVVVMKNQGFGKIIQLSGGGATQPHPFANSYAASKAAIIAGLAFHSRVSVDDVYREGISSITAEDVAVAKTMNHVIKLLAIAELTTDDRISVRVHPTLIPRSHPLAAVRDAFNAVFVEAKSAGQLMFYGRGAGGAPTASAVLGDVVAVVRHRVSNSVGPRESDYADRNIAPIGDTKTQFLIRLNVADKPGVLAAIAQVFAKEAVSIQTVRQSGRGNDAELIVVSHGATEAALSATVSALSKMDIVTKVESVLRVLGSQA